MEFTRSMKDFKLCLFTGENHLAVSVPAHLERTSTTDVVKIANGYYRAHPELTMINFQFTDEGNEGTIGVRPPGWSRTSPKLPLSQLKTWALLQVASNRCIRQRLPRLTCAYMKSLELKS